MVQFRPATLPVVPCLPRNCLPAGCNPMITCSGHLQLDHTQFFSVPYSCYQA
uniref:Uncharacterized protein n=1 Tax=Arundo donax TaxID=35708 RepID=A0A0A8ZFI0_ARUDO